MTVVAEQTLSPRVREFLAGTKQLYIDGEFVDAASGRTFVTYDPATGERLADVAHGEAEDVDRAVRAARRAFEPWAAMKPNERERLIWRVGDLLTERAAEFGQLEALDNGKSAAIASAVDTAWAADVFPLLRGLGHQDRGQHGQRVDAVRSGRRVPRLHPPRTRRGVRAHRAVELPAADGVVEARPRTRGRQHGDTQACGADPAHRAHAGRGLRGGGFPPGVVNVVTGFGDAGAALSAHDDVDKVAFTGSTEVGKKIVEAAKGNLKKVTLELGGKSPNIVFADADFDAAVQGSLNAWLFNHGQCCVAGTRLYVENSIFERFTEAVAEAASNVKIGPGLDPTTELGPLVSQEQLDRVTGYLRDGLADGARALTGGKRWGETGYFVEPTVLVDVEPDFSVVREEIFGPVVAAMPFDADEGSSPPPTTRSTDSPPASGPGHLQGASHGAPPEGRLGVDQPVQRVRHRDALRWLQAVRLGP